MTDCLIKADNLTWRPNNQLVLNQISIAINAGDIVGILGPNGSGKTSLLRCLYQHIQPSSGTLSYQGRSAQHWSRRELAQLIAVVPQQQHIDPGLTVFQLVGLGLVCHQSLLGFNVDNASERIDQAIQQVGLTRLQHRQVVSLSGGEQQRAHIARALVQQASVLLLDEPTNHLDVYYQHQILALICRLGLTVVMTLHDMSMASRYCQRLVLLNQGRMVVQGTCDQVLTTSHLSAVFKLPCRVETQLEQINVQFYPESLL